jgi:hypothetical protein
MDCPWSKAIWVDVASKFQATNSNPECGCDDAACFKDTFTNLANKGTSAQRKTAHTISSLVCWDFEKNKIITIFSRNGIAAQALSTLIKEEEAAWCLAGAPILLVAQYGGIPIDPS